MNDGVDERSSRFASHHVVANANGLCGRQDDWVPKERVDGLAAANVEVEVDTAILVQNEIADSIRSLNIVRIALERREELQKKRRLQRVSRPPRARVLLTQL